MIDLEWIGEEDNLLIGSSYKLSGYFRVRETEYTGSGNVVPIAMIDPTRLVLIIGQNNTAIGGISTQNTVTTSTGFPVSSNLPPYIFTFRDHGSLPQQAWYWINALGIKLHVLEVFEQAPPEAYGESE